MAEKIREFLKEKKWRNLKKTDWIAIAMTGVLILIIAMPSSPDTGKKILQSTGTGSVQEETKADTEAERYAYAEYLEGRLEKILSEVDGVGRVKVMITLSDSRESVIEKDRKEQQQEVTETDSGGGSRTTKEADIEQSTVYRDSGSESTPYVQKEILPSVEGVFVVAEGGGNPTVVSEISETVMALFQVEAHKIKVVKMSSKEG